MIARHGIVIGGRYAKREDTKLAEPPAAAKALIEGVVLPPGLRPGESRPKIPATGARASGKRVLSVDGQV